MSSEDELQAAINGRIDAIINNDAAPDLVREFYRPENSFAGESFELLGRGDDDDVHKFVTADFFAITLMGVSVPPDSLRRILGADSERLNGMLQRVGDDVDLWDADDAKLGAAETLFHELVEQYAGIKEVVAGKLLARKRPKLIPIVDDVVVKAIAAPPKKYWVSYRSALQDSSRRQRVRDLRPEDLNPRIADLRILDTAVWMSHSEGKPARRARERTGYPHPSPSYR